MSTSSRLFGGVILLYFVIALEVLIMISPFAAFFYAAFNPVLLFLAKWPETRWLAAFFLPHMVLPPGIFLKAVRVAGSVFFVGGAVVFLACARQVYVRKLARRGPAVGGLYRFIRHPQYDALALTGLGLAILWPRFLTIVLWAVMIGLYVLLARDEERRMIVQFGDTYREYMSRSGRFFPRSLERAVARIPVPRSPALRSLLGFVVLTAMAIGGAFALRSITVARLPLWSQGRVTAMTILPDDERMLQHRMAGVLELPEVKARLSEQAGPVLVYLVPKQYVMQGMIADTGPEWRLFEHHQPLSMIADWIFHPFRHLQGGHMMMMHHDGGTAAAMDDARGGTGGIVRRLIFLRVDTPGGSGDPASLFSIEATRVPLFFVDLDIHDLVLQDVKTLGPGTGWGDVPTPMF